MSETPRKRGRPTSIDTDGATQSLVEVFRAKGFAAASLDDLSDATGLSRPSLYRAFGDKLSMYMVAIDAFTQDAGMTALPALNDPEDLEAGLAGFYAAMLDVYFRDPDMAAGCLVFGTAPSSAEEKTIQTRLHDGIHQLDGLLRARIVRNYSDAPDEQIDIAMHIASNTLIAFSARAKSGASKTVLREMGAQTARMIDRMLANKN